MPVPSSPVVWWGSLLWLVGVGAAAFAVAWLSGTRLHIRKGAYIPLLLAVTAGLAAGYVAWLGVGFKDVITARWGWGLLAGAVAAAALALPASHQPVNRPVHGGKRVAALGLEGVVYGTAEGLLLSALPAFIGWQMIHSLGWAGPGGAVARWVLPLVGAAGVVVVHHLGYWNFRNKILVVVTAGLTLQAIAFLITGSWLAPVFAHILLHGELVIRGSEMPPQDRPEPSASTDAEPLRIAA